MRQRVPSIFLATVATGSVVALLSAQAPTPAPAAQGTVTFAKDIQPIFEKTCWNCHGASLQLADLNLSSREGALKGGEHAAAIVPGNAQQSKLFRAVAALENREITPAERNYWAFKLPVQAPLPVVSQELENPIDRFLESARAKKGL